MKTFAHVSSGGHVWFTKYRASFACWHLSKDQLITPPSHRTLTLWEGQSRTYEIYVITLQSKVSSGISSSNSEPLHVTRIKKQENPVDKENRFFACRIVLWHFCHLNVWYHIQILHFKYFEKRNIKLPEHSLRSTNLTKLVLASHKENKRYIYNKNTWHNMRFIS